MLCTSSREGSWRRPSASASSVLRTRRTTSGTLPSRTPQLGIMRLRSATEDWLASYWRTVHRELCLYDGDGRCDGKVVAPGGQYKSAWIRRFSYSRAGDLLRVMDSRRGTVGYLYDQAHRLVEEVPSRRVATPFCLRRGRQSHNAARALRRQYRRGEPPAHREWRSLLI